MPHVAYIIGSDDIFCQEKKCVFNQIDTMQINIHFNSYAQKVLVHIKIPGHAKTERV